MLGSHCLLSLLVMFSDYRMRRVTGFLDPWPILQHGIPAHAVPDRESVGGEWFGVGWAPACRSCSICPRPHNDFLFAVLAEEPGD